MIINLEQLSVAPSKKRVQRIKKRCFLIESLRRNDLNCLNELTGESITLKQEAMSTRFCEDAYSRLLIWW